MKHGSGHAVLNAVEDRFVGQQIEGVPSRESRFSEHGRVVVRLAAAAELAHAPGPDTEDSAGVADGFLTRRVINDCPCDLEALVRKPQRTGPRATCKLLAVGQQHVRGNQTLSAELQVQRLINLTQSAFLSSDSRLPSWILIMSSYHTYIATLFHLWFAEV